MVQRERHHRAHLGGLRLGVVVPKKYSRRRLLEGSWKVPGRLRLGVIVPPVHNVRALDVDLEGPDQVLADRLLALGRVCADAECVRVVEDANLQASASEL